ncbi:23S rRNA (adenine(2058)-N(6))-methyltransferase Erm(45) [Abyssicoccus albus]|uniref:23S rRNA (adenine(2058)-N(6))-methyltransferase Erm(45) n=1 Tax=Abyssicoccus albus TaxID=1817405 RepID=UPI00097E2AFE|nr:23S rRNA (adenine(2058)-N(6))-methyltransferase Erm(45) [Abyssicoccus albus]AQL56980.1 23S rRNA (adenine(2058)-N(6))-methyltransferase Erm(B) [Abyssicoccus albus]
MNQNIKFTQNFITNEKLLSNIMKQINIDENDIIYEVGTGKGHLTSKLAEKCKHVYSIELDKKLYELSSNKLQDNSRVTLINQDILQFNYPYRKKYKIVGNIPFNISTQIVKDAVFRSQASEMYFIVEEGFYKRMIDTRRTLSLQLQTQVYIQQLLPIPAGSFHPKPKVNCILIKLTRHISDIKDKHKKKYEFFISKWVNKEYSKLFTKNQYHQALKHARIKDLNKISYKQVLSVFESYILFNPRK